jgi:hypothetical protein
MNLIGVDFHKKIFTVCAHHCAGQRGSGRQLSVGRTKDRLMADRKRPYFCHFIIG